jgi:hypothetical protein
MKRLLENILYQTGFTGSAGFLPFSPYPLAHSPSASLRVVRDSEYTEFNGHYREITAIYGSLAALWRTLQQKIS